jgi:hypothetical protein
MKRVEWTWVKAHAGFLLNECADMLATKGVRNETLPASVQYLHAINEYTDHQGTNSERENRLQSQVIGLAMSHPRNRIL